MGHDIPTNHPVSLSYMKIRFLIGILLFSMLATTGYGQRQFKRQYQKALSNSHESNPTLGKYYLGINAGCPASWITLSHLDETTVKPNIGYQAGIAGERFFKNYSIGLYASLAQHGVHMHNSRTYEVSLTQTGTVERTMNIRYDVVAIRIPVAYYLRSIFSSKKLAPYVFIAPKVDLPVPIGNPTMETTFAINNGSAPVVDKKTIHPNMDAGAIAGIGLMMNVGADGNASMLLKFDLGMNMGMLNQATASAQEEGLFMRSQGIEANLTLLFRLKKPLRDAGYYFSRPRY